jgi:two-component system chemotaxis response regulator CheY
MKRLKSLVAEDEFLSRNFLARIMSEYGPCDVAVDGEEALAAVKSAYEARASYDIVFLDIVMPRMDGQEALKRIRAYEAERGVLASDCVKIVMATALADAKNIAQAFRSQCEAYVTKPYVKRTIDDQVRGMRFEE